MQLRYKNTAAPILKNNLATPIKAYEYYEECQTVEELEAIKNDSHRFRLECFMIRERLAGVTSGLLNSLDRYACKYVTDYEHALQIYSHACYLRLSAQIDLDKLTLSLEKCTGVMYQLAECNMALPLTGAAESSVTHAKERKDDVSSTKSKQMILVRADQLLNIMITKTGLDLAQHLSAMFNDVYNKRLPPSDDDDDDQPMLSLFNETVQEIFIDHLDGIQFANNPPLKSMNLFH
ncbi:unnamed protein product [Rotaria socialis]|uniref:Uncharacterized protein n=1 Tax=Rotaria socialis TaxID=392032 RepID=A0A817VEI0_9BILA|nr:unnamed protein product [Rotaria socialis]